MGKKTLKTSVRVYSVVNYAKATQTFIRTGYQEMPTEELIRRLEGSDDCHYHLRILSSGKYLFFGDLDKYGDGIDVFISKLQKFLKERYNLTFVESDLKYTTNDTKIGSYHYTIPKWYASAKILKQIHSELKEFVTEVDLSVYGNQWFRLPNQGKGNSEVGVHRIHHGEMCDFVVEIVNDASECIDKIIQSVVAEPKKTISLKSKATVSCAIDPTLDNEDEIIVIPKLTTAVVSVEKSEQKVEVVDDSCDQVVPYNENMLSLTLSKPDLYRKMFDQCYKPERFEKYQYWLSIGMAIRNIFDDEEEAINLFDYYSAKASNYDGQAQTRVKFQSLSKRSKKGYTVATIYYYAMEDNKPKFIEIMSKNSLELGQTDCCKYLKIMAGYKFVYQVSGGNVYRLYCYNGKFWQNDDTIMKKCISTELYQFLKMILIEVYWNTPEFNSLKTKLEKLKMISMKRDIVETYKEYGVNDSIRFDNNWTLLGFTDRVYDLELGCFREYRYDDYVSMTTGYDWREPTEDELETINKLIGQIMPDEAERELYLQILSTTLEGRCLERFILHNGGGGNGKGMLDDLLLVALGNYGMIGNNAILFESNRTGSNPEKANIHKKRLVIFREPPERQKFENSVVKELTGGGTFSARTHHEKETEKELNATIICECNKRPLFAEEPTPADARRLIDLYFRATFTSDPSLVDETKHIFMANPEYKTSAFQHRHKYALLKILMAQHWRYYKVNNSMLTIPKSVEDRTKEYLELSCNIVGWFKEYYEQSDESNVIKLKDVFERFSSSEYYQNLTKAEKRKYNKSFFYNYFETNIFLRRYVHVIHDAKCIKGWRLKSEESIWSGDRIDC